MGNTKHTEMILLKIQSIIVYMIVTFSHKYAL